MRQIIFIQLKFEFSEVKCFVPNTMASRLSWDKGEVNKDPRTKVEEISTPRVDAALAQPQGLGPPLILCSGWLFASSCPGLALSNQKMQ